MKIYIVHTDLLEEDDKPFYEMTDEEIINLCKKKDADGFLHEVFNSLDELADTWNCDEVFYPDMSYMRIIQYDNY